jgi:hypothetical protein
MKDRFKGWRGKCGLAALLLALFFTAAWAKTAVDHFAFGVPIRYAPDAPATVGNIRIFAYSDSAPADPAFPFSHRHLSGLFTDLRFDIQPSQTHRSLVLASPPPQVGSNLPPGSEGAPGMLSSELEFVAPANHVESAGPANFVMQTAAGQPGTESGLPIPQGSFQIDFSDVEGSDAVQDRGKIKSQWKFCGIEFEEREYEYLDRDASTIIPHWTIALPCALAAAALLFGSRKRQSKADVAAGAVQPSAAGSQNRKVAFFSGWRPKLGALTLLMSLALAGGWIRSFVVTDSLHFDIGTETVIRLHSAKDGLVCERCLDPNLVGSGFFFRTKTGLEHERAAFRPRESVELMDPQYLPLTTFGSVTLPGASDPPMASPAGSSTARNPVTEEIGIEVDDRMSVRSVMDPPVDQQIALAKFEGEAGNQSDPLPTPLPASIEVGATSEGPNSYDIVFDGAGVFMFYSPSNSSSLVVPYAYLVIPLTLLSAWLLLRRRVQPALAK